MVAASGQVQMLQLTNMRYLETEMRSQMLNFGVDALKAGSSVIEFIAYGNYLTESETETFVQALNECSSDGLQKVDLDYSTWSSLDTQKYLARLIDDKQSLETLLIYEQLGDVTIHVTFNAASAEGVTDGSIYVEQIESAT